TYVMESQPGFTNRITLEGDQLMTQLPGQPKIALWAESETRFFLKEVEAGVEFVKSDRGEVTRLVIHQGGQEVPMTRQEAPAQGAPTPKL
ncbi:MAG TPA: hypothetical protein VEQ65_10165, partial [Opitutus sp.]|nr:hypothetical protein [Opitutus sp.]